MSQKKWRGVVLNKRQEPHGEKRGTQAGKVCNSDIWMGLLILQRMERKSQRKGIESVVGIPLGGHNCLTCALFGKV